MAAPGNRVLSLSLRPRSFAELVGQDALLAALQAQFASGRVPHFFILAGAIGSGKTTLARLIAMALQCPGVDAFAADAASRLPWDRYRRLDIREVNAANDNGVDFVRALIESTRYVPIAPSCAKVIILDEAHQLTAAAQNALLTETEDACRHVYYVFSTSLPGKLLPALRRRAYIVSPRLLDAAGTRALLQHAAAHAQQQAQADHAQADPAPSLEPLVEALDMHDVRAPGLVLQAAEQYLAGMPALDCIAGAAGNPAVDAMKACRALVKGDWPACAALLKAASKQDVYPLRACMLGFLRTALLSASGAQALTLARMVTTLASSGHTAQGDDAAVLPAFLAAVCTACARAQA